MQIFASGNLIYKSSAFVLSKVRMSRFSPITSLKSNNGMFDKQDPRPWTVIQKNKNKLKVETSGPHRLLFM